MLGDEEGDEEGATHWQPLIHAGGAAGLEPDPIGGKRGGHGPLIALAPPRVWVHFVSGALRPEILDLC
jgi:hypothetical protein